MITAEKIGLLCLSALQGVCGEVVLLRSIRREEGEEEADCFSGGPEAPVSPLTSGHHKARKSNPRVC